MINVSMNNAVGIKTVAGISVHRMPDTLVVENWKEISFSFSLTVTISADLYSFCKQQKR